MFESLSQTVMISQLETEEGRGGLIVPLGETVYMVRIKEEGILDRK